MKLQLVSYEQAKALEKLGLPHLDHEGFCYRENGTLTQPIYTGEWCNTFAPTLELVTKWLREEKNIVVLPYLIGFVGIANESTPSELKTNVFGCQIVYYDKGSNEFLTLEEFTSYEEALSAGIDKAIKILKRKFE